MNVFDLKFYFFVDLDCMFDIFYNIDIIVAMYKQRPYYL